MNSNHKPIPHLSRRGVAGLTGLLACVAAPALHAQITLDFESETVDPFTTGGDWTISEDTLQGSRTAEITSTGLSFSNGAYNITGGNRALQLNLPDTGQGGNEPTDDFALYDFSSTPVGADGDIVEFQFLFKQDKDSGFFANIGVTGDVAAARPSRFSSSSVTLRGDHAGPHLGQFGKPNRRRHERQFLGWYDPPRHRARDL